MQSGSPMDKKKLEGFKKKLETRQQDLRRMVSRTQQDGRNADEDTAQDIADKAASSYNKEFLFHQSNADRQLLMMVEGALSRIREGDRKSTRLNSSHLVISYAVFCLKKKKIPSDY